MHHVTDPSGLWLKAVRRGGLTELPGIEKDEKGIECNDEHWRQVGEKQWIL
jgi:hypothetical protein